MQLFTASKAWSQDLPPYALWVDTSHELLTADATIIPFTCDYLLQSLVSLFAKSQHHHMKLAVTMDGTHDASKERLS